MLEHRRVDIVARVDVHPADKLNELPGLGPVMAAGLVEVLSDEVKRHFELSRI
ncbi:MAG: hypothetical protein ABSG76_23455 [Xanthobacteraceae bacterium]